MIRAEYVTELTGQSTKPGTLLRPGDAVSFEVTVRYDLTLADTGRIVLVFQDEKERPLFPGKTQTSIGVSRGAGEVTLSQDVTVPQELRQLRLFVPLMPAGVPRTSGELLIKYPVEGKP